MSVGHVLTLPTYLIADFFHWQSNYMLVGEMDLS